MAAAKKKAGRPGAEIGALMHAAYEQRASAALRGSDDDWRRDHLGASVLGHECDRFLYLSFRWAIAEQKDGRMLRLLERGKREEAAILRDLEAVGIANGGRSNATWPVNLPKHLGGTVDAVLFNVPGGAQHDHVGEFKTYNGKQFDRLLEKGLWSAKWEHYVQMQVYMHGTGLRWALYVAVCKDDDRIFTERIPYDEATAKDAVSRGVRIVYANTAPEKRIDKDSPPCVCVSKDGTRWPCRFYDLCHGTAMPVKNCRTCLSAVPQTDGTWRCVHKAKTIYGLEQRAGCQEHVSEPSMVNASLADADEKARRATYQRADGTTFVDGGGA